VQVFTTRTRLRRLGGRRGVLVGVLLLVVAVGVVALGERGQITDHGWPRPAMPEVSRPGQEAAAAPGGSAGGRSSAAARDAATPGGAAPDATGDPVASVGRALVRTAQLRVEADDPVALTRRVRAAIAGAAGTIAQESSTDSGAQLTVRVPADRLDRLIDAIAGLGHITDRTAQVVDATENVVDLDARVASQRASVDRVRALLAQARSIGDVVAVESELTRREADLDSLTGRLNALKDQVALSTLTVDVDKTPGPMSASPQPTGFLAGLAAGWDGLKTVAVAAGAAVGFLLPFLPVLAVILGLVWAGRRLGRTRRTPQPAGGAERPGT
jgi:uncharacterized protein DUF4349